MCQGEGEFVAFSKKTNEQQKWPNLQKLDQAMPDEGAPLFSLF